MVVRYARCLDVKAYMASGPLESAGGSSTKFAEVVLDVNVCFTDNILDFVDPWLYLPVL